MTSTYPGFHAPDTFGDVFVATAYAAVDGAICGLLFGWLYNAWPRDVDHLPRGERTTGGQAEEARHRVLVATRLVHGVA